MAGPSIRSGWGSDDDRHGREDATRVVAGFLVAASLISPGRLRVTMPPMIFPARCPACGKDVKFMEFKIEPCTPGSPGAEENVYGFRCMQCRTVQPEMRDAKGMLHAWTEGKHVEAAP